MPRKARVFKSHPRLVVFVNTPGAALMPFADFVPAVVLGAMPGEQAGNALADVLFGAVNPAARLSLTMPYQENQIQYAPPRRGALTRTVRESVWSTSEPHAYRANAR